MNNYYIKFFHDYQHFQQGASIKTFVSLASEIQFRRSLLTLADQVLIIQKKKIQNQENQVVSFSFRIIGLLIITFIVGIFLLSNYFCRNQQVSLPIMKLTPQIKKQKMKNNQIFLQNSKKHHEGRLLMKDRDQQPLIRNLETKKNIYNIFSRVRKFQRPDVPQNSSGITKQQVLNAHEYISLKDTLDQNQISKMQKQYYQQKYQISSFMEELPICVVVPSFNNIANNRYKANMNSILQQNYQNFHIVFIDDASTDQTFNKTLDLIRSRNFPMDRVTMIRNDIQKFAMYNLRRAAMEFCKSQQLFIIVDGDDELLGRQVFKLYNALFQNTGAYFVYTNFMTSAEVVGFSRPIPQRIKQHNKYRDFPFIISHLRAFYTKLFQFVDDQDLQDKNGEYYRAANDVAICIPILQMSGTKVEYFPQLTYLYNYQTGLNNHLIRTKEQKTNDMLVRKKKRYGKIQNLFQKVQ